MTCTDRFIILHSGALLSGTPKTISELQAMIRNGQGPKPIPGVKEVVYAIPAGHYGIPRDHLQILDQGLLKMASLFSDGRWYGLDRKQLTNPEFWLWLDSINWSRPKSTAMESLAELMG